VVSTWQAMLAARAFRIRSTSNISQWTAEAVEDEPMTFRHAAAVALLAATCFECTLPLTPQSVDQSPKTGCYFKGSVLVTVGPPPIDPYEWYCGTRAEMNNCSALHQLHCHPMFESPFPPPITNCELCTAPTATTPNQSVPVSP